MTKYEQLMQQRMLDLFGLAPVSASAPVSVSVSAPAPAQAPVPVPAPAPLPVPEMRRKKTVVAGTTGPPPAATAETAGPSDFASCVQSVRSLVFEEMSHSKHLKTKDKARIANFKEHKTMALGGRSEQLHKHSAKHLKQMRQAKQRKIKAQEELVKTQQVVSESLVKFRAGEAQRRKQANMRGKSQRKIAAKLLVVPGHKR